MLGPQESMRSASHFLNHKDSTYIATLVHVVIAISSRAQTSDTSSVPGWGALAFMAKHAGSKEIDLSLIHI